MNCEQCGAKLKGIKARKGEKLVARICSCGHYNFTPYGERGR